MDEIGKLEETQQGPDAVPQGTAPGLAGVIPSNTPPLISNGCEWTGGEDWLEWCAYVDWGERWDELSATLKTAKENAADARSCKASGFDLVRFGLYEAKVGPSGTSLGKTGKGMYMAYRLHCEGMAIQMANRGRAEGDQPNVVLRAGGTECLQLGGFGCLELGRAIISTMGGEVKREKLSRVDMCVDLPGIPMELFAVAYREGRYVCRARARGYEESIGITVYLGKHPLRLRIYDKTAELQVHGDTVKLFLMRERRWGGRDVAHATRVEFEIGREALKDRGIDTPEDYFRKRADLISYLCTEWVRFTNGEVDRANTSRAPVWPMWQRVTEGFLGWTGAPQGESLEALDRGPVDVGQLQKQAVGVLLTAACNQGKSPETATDFVAYVTKTVKATIGGMNLKSEIARREVRLPG